MLEARSWVPETQRKQHCWYVSVHFSKHLWSVSAVLGTAGGSGEAERQVLAMGEFTVLPGRPTQPKIQLRLWVAGLEWGAGGVGVEGLMMSGGAYFCSPESLSAN